MITDMHPQMDRIEKEIILTILDDALNMGYTVTVCDGEEDVIKKSGNKEAIFAEMFSTGEDTLTFYQGDRRVGWLFLVYGNREAVISDYADNVKMNALLVNAEVLVEKYS
jgi:hypothetical protein